MNIAGFAAMGIDKYKAKAHAWRIPEKTLFGLSLLGGSAGTWAGMYAFRHKTKHWYFVKGDASYFLYSCGNCVCYPQKFLLDGVTKNIMIPFDPLIVILYLGKK